MKDKKKLGMLLSNLNVVLGNSLFLLQPFGIQEASPKKKFKLSNARGNCIQ